jgi:uncharacterized protein (TIGR00255 family)
MAGRSPQSATSEGVSAAAKGRRALRSMTGYAQAQVIESGWTLRISIRSVNHRFLDLHVRVPDGFEPLEPRIRQMVRERVHRGHLDVTLYHELAGPAAVGVNEEVAAAYVQAVNSLRQKFEVQAEPDLASILRLPGVIGSPIASLDEQLERLESAAAHCLSDALDRLDRMRESEANHLREEMSGRLGTIASHTAKVATIAGRARPAFARRLEQRLKELLGETQLDPARLAQEASIAAERSDVSEELTRLASHVQQFRDLLSGTSEVGKKLDFLLQEMQRESNTLLSKAPGNEAEGLEITQLGLEIKSEIEKLREQVQNIE